MRDPVTTISGAGTDAAGAPDWVVADTGAVCAIAVVAGNSNATAIAAQLLERNTWLLFMFFPPRDKKPEKTAIRRGST
jgi:hypothetical protein